MNQYKKSSKRILKSKINQSFIHYQSMKVGIALLTGLLVANGAATGFKLDIGGCKTQKNIDRDAFSCPCSGGSGDYDWHYTQLPQGWSAQKDRIIAPKGKFQDRKVYGAKVQVLDIRTKQSVKKSLFFNFENGKVGKIFDHDFDFDIDFLVPGARGKTQKDDFNLNIDSRKVNIQRLFDDADGIGGGNGLNKLKPYFLGNGLYKGDDKNPYINRLPNEDQVIKIIEAGSSKDVRVLIVNAARSRSNCNDISGFLEKLLQRLRNKIQSFKDDIDGAQKIVFTIQQQLKFLQIQLKDAQGSSQVNLKDLQAKLKAFKDDLENIKAFRDKYQAELNKTNKNIDALQVDVSKFVAESKKIQEQDNKKVRRINDINDEISRLEDRIKGLKNQRSGIDKDRQLLQVRLNEFKSKIDVSRIRIQEAKFYVIELRTKIKKANDDLDATRGKIADLEKAIKSNNLNSQQRVKEIQAKIADFQRDLAAALNKLKKIDPIFKDLNDNYEELARIGDNSFYGCYKTLFNDDKVQFREDDDDGVEFYGQQSFYDYLSKIFGYSNAGNIRPGDYGTVIIREVSNAVKFDKLKVKQTNIFTKDWANAYGSPFDDDFDDDFVGGKFKDNDFGCDGINDKNVKGFKGSIQSIRKNVARVVSDKGVQCNVYLGGCTRIETANKKIPQAGDDIYWRGTNKKGGKSNDYNAHHVTCF